MDELVSGAVTRTYTYGRQLISENQFIGSTWTPSFYGYDGHGNARFLTNAAGTITDTYAFDAFGAQIASTGTTPNPYLYSGERFDSALNLYQLRARYYNMLTGRFETMDPYSGNIFDPGTLHKYLYTRDNPVNRVDPSGRDDVDEYGRVIVSMNDMTISIARFAKLELTQEQCITIALAWMLEHPDGDPGSAWLVYLYCMGGFKI